MSTRWSKLEFEPAARDNCLGIDYRLGTITLALPRRQAHSANSYRQKMFTLLYLRRDG
jgi:hypothetical protein